ncbi:hypothetical protein [Saccharothrix australiensis]|uniref:PKD domain-containing protein n=1 Tax=Saccharothrix australiensis TaxID=2072 RepID=A0A495W6P0_9PSEU|nr:hypothetical protein [Saccharothrix australiensis]RKT55468.1 hypothetical protein C8E97_4137 [Saccharothrix australiensis]
MRRTTKRTSVVALVALAIAVLAPGLAHAEPSANDDFDTATTIGALPFTTTEDTTTATKADDDPTSCYHWGSRTVWYHYTPTADGLVRVAANSTAQRPLIAVYTGKRGALTQVPGACSADTGTPETFPATAGTTYHILLIEYYGGGQVRLDVSAQPPAPNDDRAAAEVLDFPAARTGDLSHASAEPGEAAASCDTAADRSAWYRYTPDRTRSVSVSVSLRHQAVVTVYRGVTADPATEVDCAVVGDQGPGSVFTATAGETYLVRVAARPEHAGWFDLRVRNAPSLVPVVSPDPPRPSVFDDIEFDLWANGALGRPVTGGAIRFGDGASAPVGGDAPRHRYAVDGDYLVEATLSTDDGRSGTATRMVEVRTHDVAIGDFAVPASGRVGRTGTIRVSVTNTRYDETVQVELYRQAASGYSERLGALSQWVAASAGGAVAFPFAYTYRAEDVAAGVTFKAVAKLSERYDGDARPADNERQATTATVRPAPGVG